MADEQYTPTERWAQGTYVDGVEAQVGGRHESEKARAEFDRFLARVRRDAWQEALDGLIAWHRENAQDPETPTPIRRGIQAMAAEAQRYRDTHYPETEG